MELDGWRWMDADGWLGMDGWMDGWMDRWKKGRKKGRKGGREEGRESLPLLSRGKPWENGKKLCTDQTPMLPRCIFPSCDGTAFSILNLGEVPAAAPELRELPHGDLPALHE